MVALPATVASRDLDQLRRSFGGEVITPADASYDDARRLWNAVHDRRPAVILRPTSAAEVATAIRFGRDHGLELAVRSGGHSTPGSLGVRRRPRRGPVRDARGRGRPARRGPPERTAARSSASSMSPPRRTASSARSASSVTRASRGSRSAAASAACSGSSASRSTTSPRSSSSRPTAGSCARARPRSRSCSGACAAPAGTSGSRRPSSSALQPFGPDLHRGVLVFPATQVQEVWAAFRDYALQRTGRGVAHLRHRPGRAGRRLPGRHRRPADRLHRLQPQRRGGRGRARHGGSARGPEAAVRDHRQRAVPRGPDRPRPRARRGVADRSSRASTRTTSGPRRSTSSWSSSPTAPGEGTFSVTALGGAIGRVPEDATAYAGRAAAFDLSADTGLGGPGARRREPRLDPTGDGGGRAGRDPWPLRERERRRRPRGDPADLRRREARPPRRPEADLGPGQRVPPEPQRGPRAGRTPTIHHRRRPRKLRRCRWRRPSARV